jgi:hypothetical protein
MLHCDKFSLCVALSSSLQLHWALNIMAEIAKEFVTPVRGPSQSDSLRDEEGGGADGMEMSKQAATVTPADFSREETNTKEDGGVTPLGIDASGQIEESMEDRKVRFDKLEKTGSLSDSPSSTDSQRGLVSRRGGRISSPGRASKGSPKDSILEFKTFCSPTQATNDSVPSLRSDSNPETAKEEKESASLAAASEKQEQGATPRKANQIEKKNNVSFSPVPPPRTPVRSPIGAGGGRFQSLPSLDDDALRSPGSFFLSPATPIPSSRNLKSGGSFDKSLPVKGVTANEELGKPAGRQPMRSPKTPRSPRTPKRDDRDRFLATPTDFATDYGKHTNSESFDQSNGMLRWRFPRFRLIEFSPARDFSSAFLVAVSFSKRALLSRWLWFNSKYPPRCSSDT